MTGQAKRKNSLITGHQSLDSIPAGSRKSSLLKNLLVDDEKNSAIDEGSEHNSIDDSRTNSVIDEDSRRSSLVESVGDSSRKNSAILQTIGEGDRRTSIGPTDDVSKAYEELLKYSARKFSIFVPIDYKDEKTILDDADYFMSKKECDYGMCQCCPVEKKLHTNWESIEEIIENDPEIIFDSDDNPIVVEPVHNECGNVNNNHSEKLPSVFKTLYNKLSQTSLSE